jgi:hypothetical protein
LDTARPRGLDPAGGGQEQACRHVRQPTGSSVAAGVAVDLVGRGSAALGGIPRCSGQEFQGQHKLNSEWIFFDRSYVLAWQPSSGTGRNNSAAPKDPFLLLRQIHSTAACSSSSRQAPATRPRPDTVQRGRLRWEAATGGPSGVEHTMQQWLPLPYEAKCGVARSVVAGGWYLTPSQLASVAVWAKVSAYNPTSIAGCLHCLPDPRHRCSHTSLRHGRRSFVAGSWGC